MIVKYEKTVEVSVDVRRVRLELPVRYWEEDIPNDFPFRQGDTWTAEVEVDTGKVVGWPQGKSGALHMKVCDEGTYTLLDGKGQAIAKIEQNYAPNKAVPGCYGDYVELDINEHGVVTNWYKNPDFSAFFRHEE